MKHKLKKILCLTILGMLFTTQSCQEERFEEQNNSKVKVSKVKLNDTKILNNFSLMKQIKKVKTKGEMFKNTNKMVYDSINDFYIDDENGKLIQTNNGYESYTFPISRTTANEYELENIIFSKSGDEYDVSVIQYNLNENELLTLESDLVFTPEITPNIIPISKMTIPCNTIIDECIAGIDASGSYFFYITYVDPCPGNSGVGIVDGSGSGTGSSGSGTGTGTGSGGSSSGSGTGTGGGSTGGVGTGASTGGSGGILTSPTPGGGGSGTANIPCEKIKGATSNNSAYMSNFRNINKPSVLSQPMEKGFSQVGSQYIYGQAIGGEAVKIPPGAKNFTHTHPNRPFTTIEGDEFHGNVKMHSPADLLALLTTCQNANTDPTNTFGVMISDEGIFAITLLEAVTPAEISQINPKWNKFKTKYDREARDIISDYRDADQAEIRKEETQKLFLKLLKDLGLENKVGLFEGEEELDINIKINWTRKKLNASGSLVPEGC